MHCGYRSVSIYDTGFDNDKLPLLFLENKNANIAVKTSTGKSNRETIHNVVMQGTIWGTGAVYSAQRAWTNLVN